eukprot:scaffold140_cov247-Pinguiococcus_pyrenoidosus.AAC.8
MAQLTRVNDPVAPLLSAEMASSSRRGQLGGRGTHWGTRTQVAEHPWSTFAYLWVIFPSGALRSRAQGPCRGLFLLFLAVAPPLA